MTTETSTLDRLIAWAALLFSGIAIFIAIRTYRRQPELITKQIDELDRKRRERNEANVAVLLGRQGVGCYIQISNEGPAEARAVDLRFPDNNSPVPEGEAERTLPIKVLQPRGEVRLIAVIVMGNSPPYHVIVSWSDGRGQQARESTLG